MGPFCHIALALALATTGAAFEDVHGRFWVDVPDGWNYTPAPGDKGGAIFQKSNQRLLGQVMIRELQVREGTTIDDFAAQLNDARAAEPGYRVVKSELSFVGGEPGMRRRYVIFINGDPQLTKMVDETFLVLKDKAYVIRAEAMAEVFSVFEDDFDKFSGTFGLGNRSAAAAARARAKLAGRWLMVSNPGVRFELTKDGNFDLAGVFGRFKVHGTYLVITPKGGAPETFRWRLEDNDLILRSNNLDEPIRYRREGSGSFAQEAVPTLIGRWQSHGKGGYRLTLTPAGTAILNKRYGTYTATDGVLVMNFKGRRVTASYDLDTASQLILSGGRFGKGVAFSKLAKGDVWHDATEPKKGKPGKRSKQRGGGHRPESGKD